MPLMPCCPSDRWGLPGALIPVSSHAPGRNGRGRRLAGTLLRSRSGLWMPASGPEAIRRPGAMRGLGCRRDGAAGRAGERRLGLHRRGPSGKG